MPIPIDIYKSGVKSSAETQTITRIIEFLKLHPAMAYSLTDLSYELRTTYSKLHAALKSLKSMEYIDFRFIGRTKYFIFKKGGHQNDK
jgi:DNA-binding MarR family transcriptional regulator